MSLTGDPTNSAPVPVPDGAGVSDLQSRCRPMPASFVLYCGHCGKVLTACACVRVAVPVVALAPSVDEPPPSGWRDRPALL